MLGDQVKLRGVQRDCINGLLHRIQINHFRIARHAIAIATLGRKVLGYKNRLITGNHMHSWLTEFVIKSVYKVASRNLVSIHKNLRCGITLYYAVDVCLIGYCIVLAGNRDVMFAPGCSRIHLLKQVVSRIGCAPLALDIYFTATAVNSYFFTRTRGGNRLDCGSG